MGNRGSRFVHYQRIYPVFELEVWTGIVKAIKVTFSEVPSTLASTKVVPGFVPRVKVVSANPSAPVDIVVGEKMSITPSFESDTNVRNWISILIFHYHYKRDLSNGESGLPFCPFPECISNVRGVVVAIKMGLTENSIYTCFYYNCSNTLSEGLRLFCA